MNSRLVFATLALAAAGQSIGEQRPVIGSVDVNSIGFPVSLDATNNVAYVGSVSGNWSQLQVVNVTNNIPELLGSLPLTETEEPMLATAITRSGDKLYMTFTGEESFLAVADVSSLEEPTLDGVISLDECLLPTSVAYNNDHLYISCPSPLASSLLIFDVSSSTPSLVGTLSLECSLESVAISETVLYLACGEFYWTATLTNPTTPIVGVSRPVVGFARSLAIYDDSVFVASVDIESNGTSYLDHYIAGANSDVRVATYSFPATDVASLTVAPVNGTNYAFLACGAEGLRIMNLQAEDKDAALTGYVPVTAETSGQVAVEGDYLYAADSPNRFIIVDTLDIVPSNDDDDDDGPSAAVIAVAVIVPVACIAGLAGGYFYYKSKTAVAGSYSSMA